MDVDLSTSLDNFLPMIQPLVAGEAGVAIGSRLLKYSRTSRGLKGSLSHVATTTLSNGRLAPNLATHSVASRRSLAMMLIGLSARLLGFSNFSMLLPNVLAGVGSVWLVHGAVKRQFGLASAGIAGATMMLISVTTLMFGFNSPDVILTLMLATSGYTFLRSLEGKRSLLWLGLAELFTGLVFNTKILQGLMVLLVMAVVYLVFARPPIVTRFMHLVFAGLITTISTLWWSVLVWLTPAGSRPWVGSVNDSNIWSLIFGYNGFGRLLGGRGGVSSSGGMSGTATLQTAGSTTQTMTDGAGMMPGGMGSGSGGGQVAGRYGFWWTNGNF